MHLDDASLNWCGLHRGVITTAITATTRAATPTVAAYATTGITAGFDFFLLGLLIRPARRQLGAFDFLAVFGNSCACRLGCSCRAGSRLVQSAFNGFAVSNRCLNGLWRFFRNKHLFGCTHHGANRFCFSQSGAPAGIEVFGFGRIFFGLRFGIGFALGDGFSRSDRGSFRICISRSNGRRLLQCFAIFVFLDLAQATLFCQLFFLSADKFSLATGFFFATRKFSLVKNWCNNNWFSRFLKISRLAFITFDEGAFLAHFNLNGAGFTGGVSLFDLAGGLFHQGDFFALRRVCSVTGF